MWDSKLKFQCPIPPQDATIVFEGLKQTYFVMRLFENQQEQQRQNQLILLTKYSNPLKKYGENIQGVCL
jgi:hypothetical protein